MIRARITGGVLTSEQWLALDEIGRNYGGNTMRLTTRETFQFHGIIKTNVKAAIQRINSVMLNTIAACGDINRNPVIPSARLRDPA